jgi:RNA polymerase sigma-70 factor (sigma-E family)
LIDDPPNPDRVELRPTLDTNRGGSRVARSYDEEFAAFAAGSLPGLRRTAYLLCGDWHRAEDAAQEALIRVYRAWHRIERREGLFGYARRATVRIVVDESRRPWRRERVGHEPASSGDAVADHDTGVVERDEIVRALTRLSPRRRACLVLRFYLDLSVAETARHLGCSEGTVKSQTSDALRALRPLLTGAGTEAETGSHR